MKWKNLSFWTRGGILGLAVNFIFIIGGIIFSIPGMGNVALLEFWKFQDHFFFDFYYILSVIFGITMCFFIGASIGWIIHKLKPEKEFSYNNI